jgi:hypothetical protein
MYTNIPFGEIYNIVNGILNNDNEISADERQDFRIPLNAILEQNYIKFNDQFYSQNEGLAMDVPTSAILGETFVQYLEHTKIIRILDKHQIVVIIFHHPVVLRHHSILLTYPSIIQL